MVARFSRVSLLVFKDVKSLSHTHTGPSKAHVMSTVIHRDDKGPLASFSVAASSWENEVCLLESACTSVRDSLLAETTSSSYPLLFEGAAV